LAAIAAAPSGARGAGAVATATATAATATTAGGVATIAAIRAHAGSSTEPALATGGCIASDLGGREADIAAGDCDRAARRAAAIPSNAAVSAGATFFAVGGQIIGARRAAFAASSTSI
jgi:hypothetical protein